jgi:hypothetical protein
MPRPALKAIIDSVRAGTGRPINVNFITSLTETGEMPVLAARRPGRLGTDRRRGHGGDGDRRDEHDPSRWERTT